MGFVAEIAKDGDRVLDYGCGNGRLLDVIGKKKIDYSGADVSAELIARARDRFPEYSHKFNRISSEASLSFPDDFFNVVFSIAVFHHFPLRHAEKSAKELFRVTAPSGTVVVTAWNLWQKKYRCGIFGPAAILGKIFNAGNYRGLGMLDAIIPFKNDDGKVFHRYHRAYTEKELRRVFSKAGFSVEKCFVSGDKNIVLIAKKRQLIVL